MNRLLSAVRRVTYALWRRRVRGALGRADPCTLFGLKFEIAPGVLHPRHFASSRLLARHLRSLDLRGLRVADIGTGSGLLALLAAQAGAEVVAVDINPTAVLCASENVQRNGLTDRVEVFASDVFDGLPADLRFNLILSNPPFYSREPGNIEDHAFAAGADNGFFRRLAEGLPQRLATNGALLLVQSSDADFAPISKIFDQNGFSGRPIVEQRRVFETLTIWEFRATASPRIKLTGKGATLS